MPPSLKVGGILDSVGKWKKNLSRQIIAWIDPTPDIAAHLEVEMGARRISTHTHRANFVALKYRLTTPEVDAVKMCIKGLPAISMIDDDHVPIAVVVPPCIDDDAGIRSVDCVSDTAANINGFMKTGDVGVAGEPRG